MLKSFERAISQKRAIVSSRDRAMSRASYAVTVAELPRDRLANPCRFGGRCSWDTQSGYKDYRNPGGLCCGIISTLSWPTKEEEGAMKYSSRSGGRAKSGKTWRPRYITSSGTFPRYAHSRFMSITQYPCPRYLSRGRM